MQAKGDQAGDGQPFARRSTKAQTTSQRVSVRQVALAHSARAQRLWPIGFPATAALRPQGRFRTVRRGESPKHGHGGNNARWRAVFAAGRRSRAQEQSRSRILWSDPGSYGRTMSSEPEAQNQTPAKSPTWPSGQATRTVHCADSAVRRWRRARRLPLRPLRRCKTGACPLTRTCTSLPSTRHRGFLAEASSAPLIQAPLGFRSAAPDALRRAPCVAGSGQSEC